MKRFINFIRDTIYDINYFLFTLIIIVLVAFILQNRISYIFSRDYASIQGNIPKTTTKVESESIYASDNMPEIDITVILPDGSDIVSKASILTQSGVIDDQEKFLNIINTYNLQDKVLSGEFSIKKGSTLEEIINIVTNDALLEAKGE
ncbi:hypothetical protein [Miniphocaeibacter halophilus]|uniref:Uncharacterized protein n=1 Tax=Miniphocaeibacter halophilus TaxID=2931922 RepID=A0AC61MPK1_9FIRM|nr:hypothetical protein [Miniphocaeibacter halophilus]QQK07490.1 hypothetical protein JFY71_09325 [Miniphocaeibacter halophilus]